VNLVSIARRGRVGSVKSCSDLFGLDFKPSFWNDQAETLIAGGTAWMLDDLPKEERQISRLFDLLHHDDVVYRVAALLDEKRDDKKTVRNKAALAGFNAFLQLPRENTRPSVLGTTQTHLRLFDSELIRRVTDTTSIDLAGLVSGEPMSIYIIVPPYRLAAYRPVLRLWLSGLLLALTRRECVPEHRTLMLSMRWETWERSRRF